MTQLSQSKLQVSGQPRFGRIGRAVCHFAFVAAVAAWTPTVHADEGYVSWQAGAYHPDYAHVVAGATPGNWQPESGFVWLTNESTDLRVVNTLPARGFLESSDRLKLALNVAHPTVTLKQIQFEESRTSRNPNASFEITYRYYWTDAFGDPGQTLLAFAFNQRGGILGVRSLGSTSLFRPFAASEMVLQLLRDEIRKEQQAKGQTVEGLVMDLALSESPQQLVTNLLWLDQL